MLSSHFVLLGACQIRFEYYRGKQSKRRKTKTEAIIDLLEIGTFVVEQAGSLEDPELVKYLQDNLYNVQLVDDIMKWPQDRIDAILGALVSERDIRLRERMKRI